NIDYCFAVTVGQRVKPGKFRVRDFDFKYADGPHYLLVADAQSKSPEDAYEQYDYDPGAFTWLEDGSALPAADDKGMARSNTEEGKGILSAEYYGERQRRNVVTFKTSAADLGPGWIVGINQESSREDHPRKDLAPDKKLLVTETAIEGEHNAWQMTVTSVF